MADLYPTTTALIPFQFDARTIQVRLDDNGNPWWVLHEICAVLDLSNPSRVASRLKSTESITLTFSESGLAHTILLVNEPGLYRLIMRSNKPEATRFQEWVFEEVLPQIRKTGKYEPAAPALPSYHAQIEDFRLCATFLSELGMLEDRDKLMLADMARTAVHSHHQLSQGDTLALPMPQGFFLADRVKHLGYVLTRKQEASLMSSGLARQVATEYRQQHGTEPRKSSRFVDGAVRPVNWYKETEARWIDTIIQAACAQKGFGIVT